MFILYHAYSLNAIIRIVTRKLIMPLYERTKITDALHNICGFRTDFNFITKQSYKNTYRSKKVSTASKKRNYVS